MDGSIRKLETPSIIYQQTHRLNKKERKMKRDETKKKMVWFKVYFDLMVWISLKQQYFTVATLALRVANCSPILLESKYQIFALGCQGLCDRLILIFVQPSVKTLGLILAIAPMRMFNLGSTLTLTPSVKWA